MSDTSQGKRDSAQRRHVGKIKIEKRKLDPWYNVADNLSVTLRAN